MTTTNIGPCDCCGEATNCDCALPDEIIVHLSGLTGACADFNGDYPQSVGLLYIIPLTGGPHGSGTLNIVGGCDPDNMETGTGWEAEIITIGTLVRWDWRGEFTYYCDGGVLDLDFNTGCTGTPVLELEYVY